MHRLVLVAFLAIVCLALAAGPGRADLITVEFTGTITRLEGGIPGGPAVIPGDPFRAVLTYDRSAVLVGDRYIPLGAITFTVGGQDYPSWWDSLTADHGDGSIHFTTGNAATYDVPGLPENHLDFFGPGLGSHLPDLTRESFTRATAWMLLLADNPSGGRWYVEAAIRGTAPEPGTLTLLGIAGGALAGRAALRRFGGRTRRASGRWRV